VVSREAIMRARLGFILVCVLLVGADGPPTDFGGARLEFTPGARWDMVRGWHGRHPIEKAFLEAVEGGSLHLEWLKNDHHWGWWVPASRFEGGALRTNLDLYINYTHTTTWLTVPTTIRLVGDCLEVRTTISNPAGQDVDVHLRFKRASRGREGRRR
jgi:hypothetical protein